MRRIIILTLIAFNVNQANAQKITSFETDENLKSSNLLKCVDLSHVKNTNTPVDIYYGMKECIKLKDYRNAANLFALAGVYGRYDSYRVKDKSAHQVIRVLQQNVLSDISDIERDSLIHNVNDVLKLNSNKLRVLCKAIQNIGVPNYYPKYMIQHGMKAFTDENDTGLNEKFDSEKSWNLALKEYLHCEE